MKSPNSVFLASILAITSPMAVAQDNPFAASSAENPFVASQGDRYQGVFQSDAVRLELERSGDDFTGSLYYVATDQTYDVTAELVDGTLSGAFNTAGKSFPFTFKLHDDGANGVFKTEGYSGALMRVNAGTESAKSIKPLSRVDELLEEAISIANTAPAALRNSALSQIVFSVASVGKLDRARDLANSIPPSDLSRDGAFVGIAQGQLDNGDLAGARATANTIANESMRSVAENAIIVYQVTNGEIDAGLTEARNRTTPKDRIPILTSISMALRNDGDAMRANAVLAEANANYQAIEEQAERDQAVFSLAIAYARTGDFTTPLAMIKDMEDEYSQLVGYAMVGKEQAIAGDLTGAKATAEVTLKSARRLKNKFMRPSGIAQAATVYAALDDDAKVEELILMIAKGGNDPSVARITVASTQIQLKKFGKARNTLAIIHNPQMNAVLSQAVALDQAEKNDFDGALATARSISEINIRASAIATIATLIAKK